MTGYIPTKNLTQTELDTINSKNEEDLVTYIFDHNEDDEQDFDDLFEQQQSILQRYTDQEDYGYGAEESLEPR